MAKYKIKYVHNVIETYESEIIEAKDEDEAMKKYYNGACENEKLLSSKDRSGIEDIELITEGDAKEKQITKPFAELGCGEQLEAWQQFILSGGK